MKKIIVPFFISHQGCPHQCVFCDQQAISGSSGRLPAAAELLATVRDWQETAGGAPLEVAFYGGSFTMLPGEQQQELLEPLQPLLRSGEISSIRLSTRPDGVAAGSARFLRQSGVSLVELGVQSMDDRVLSLAGRGHSAQETIAAFAALRGAGLRVGAQLMPGLPGESAAGAIASFRQILALRPDLLRIYPAIVLNGTGLARMYQQGSYRPLSLDEAVAICKVMLHDAARAGIPVIRAGLQPTAELSLGGEVIAGPYHPAFRQLAEGERWFDLLQLLVKEFSPGAALTLSTARREISAVAGQKRRNIKRLAQFSGVRIAALHGDDSLPAGRVTITAQGRSVHGDLLRDLSYP